MLKILVCPANHKNTYANGANEKGVMEALAPLLVNELDKYEGVIAHITKTYNSNGQYDGRPEEAKAAGVDLYLALHTNAFKGNETGACAFYHNDYPKTREVAAAFVKNLNAICPIKSNRAAPAIYAWNTSNWNFGELRVPASLGIAPVLVEHEFHDNLNGANWIVNNLPAIAKADAKAIAEAYGLKLKEETVVSPTPPASDTVEVNVSSGVKRIIINLC